MNTATVTLLGKHGGMVRRYRKVSKRRFSGIIKAVPHSECLIYVEYGKCKDVYGRTQDFINEGIYTNDEEAKLAIDAFLE